jgi:Domain of unknown function (DUF1707)
MFSLVVWVSSWPAGDRVRPGDCSDANSSLVSVAMTEEFRASDVERDAVVGRLRDQCAVGRLSIDELDARVERAYAAVTRRELNRLVSDLPAETPRVDSIARRHRIFWPGIAPFSEQRHLTTSCEDSFAAAQQEMVPRMGTQGFHLDEEIWPRRLRFVSDTGLLITVMFHPASDGGTEVAAFGHGPRAIRKAFATLSD